MEPLLREYNVDLSIWAHEHDYERFWPVYDYTVLNGSYENPYTEPKGPVHIVSGSAVRTATFTEYFKHLYHFTCVEKLS